MNLTSDIDTPNESQLSVFHHEECPFWLSDMPLPTCNTGFVYMLVSTRDFSYTYIGMTDNIATCLSQHNSGYGSMSTEPISLRPFALFAYVCGFEGNRQAMFSFESRWKYLRDFERNRGMVCIKQIARLPSRMVEFWKDLELTLVLNVID